MERVDAWFRALDMRYGDTVYVDGGAMAAREQVAMVAGRYGILVNQGSPATAGVLGPDAVRVVVSRTAARVLIDQKLGGDIVYISSKNSVFAGPNNIAYSAVKADQAHQVRLLAAELGEHGVKVNGINPDGVVRGSGIFASGWGANRAATYGVDEQDLGKFYAQRTILKREVLPEHVANAVAVLTGPDLSHTTGLHIPVDAGVAAAFLR